VELSKYRSPCFSSLKRQRPAVSSATSTTISQLQLLHAKQKNKINTKLHITYCFQSHLELQRLQVQTKQNTSHITTV